MWSYFFPFGGLRVFLPGSATEKVRPPVLKVLNPAALSSASFRIALAHPDWVKFATASLLVGGAWST